MKRRTFLKSVSMLGLAMTALSGVLAAEPVQTSIERLDPALDAVIAPGTKIERVATGFVFTEGPMWRQGRLWFSDVQRDQLLAVSPAGKVEISILVSPTFVTPLVTTLPIPISK